MTDKDFYYLIFHNFIILIETYIKKDVVDQYKKKLQYAILANIYIYIFGHQKQLIFGLISN